MDMILEAYLLKGTEGVNVSAALACNTIVKTVVALHALLPLLHLLLAGLAKASLGHILLKAPKYSALAYIVAHAEVLGVETESSLAQQLQFVPGCSSSSHKAQHL